MRGWNASWAKARAATATVQQPRHAHAWASRKQQAQTETRSRNACDLVGRAAPRYDSPTTPKISELQRQLASSPAGNFAQGVPRHYRETLPPKPPQSPPLAPIESPQCACHAPNNLCGTGSSLAAAKSAEPPCTSRPEGGEVAIHGLPRPGASSISIGKHPAQLTAMHHGRLHSHRDATEVARRLLPVSADETARVLASVCTVNS